MCPFKTRAGFLSLGFALFLSGVGHADMIDLSAYGTNGWINNAYFEQSNPHPTGTGVIQSFLRVQSNKTEKGYNTDGALEFDTKAGAFTHSLQVGDVARVTINGIEYAEFLLDINEANGKKSLLSLDVMEIHIEDAPDMTEYSSTFGPAVYDMDAGGDNWIKMDYGLNSGSGSGDVLAYIPYVLFGDDPNSYLYLYCEFGHELASDAGFEEWAVRMTDSSTPVPEPAMLTFICMGGLALLKRRR